MKFNEWFNNIADSGLACDTYLNKALGAKSKLHLMDVALDVNGVAFLCDMMSQDKGLSYEIIKVEFKNYINGNYKAEITKDNGKGYSSCVYCEYNEEIEVDTTSTALFGCKCRVIVRPYDFAYLYLDKNCDIDICCPESSRVKVHYWQGAFITIDGDGQVELNEHE